MSDHSTSAITARTIFIEGHVQGVFFREWTVTQANTLGISGWVRNRRDGRVEVYARGDQAALDRFTDLLQRGSPASRVDSVTVSDAHIEDAVGFSRRGTI